MVLVTTEAIVQREAKGPLKMETITIPELKENEALIEMHASGICHTDVAQITGKIPLGTRPAVYGHEGGGVVLDFGSGVTGLSKGDKVLLSFTHCEQCKQCKKGYPSYCDEFMPYNFNCTRQDGTATFRDASGEAEVWGSYFGQSSFAKVSIVHRSSIVKVPPETPLEKFAPLGCGYMTGAGTILNSLNVQAGDSVVVFGCGGVGLAGVMAAKIRGANPIIGVDLHENRLAIAKELGCTHVLNGSLADKLPEEIAKICPPKGADFAMDTTGVAAVINTMIDCLGNMGKAAQVGSTPPEARAVINPAVHLIAGRQYIGACEGDGTAAQMIPYLIDQYHKGNFPIDKLNKYYDAKDFEKAIHDMHTGETLKPVLRWR